jgi:tight adherence protein B
LRDDEQIRRETAAQVAGPVATCVLLALLPLFGLAMGGALGAEPLDLLFGTPVGVGLLTCAAVLEMAGLVWMTRITGRVLRR